MTVSIAAITALSATGTYELHPLGTAKALSVVGGKVAKFVPNANFSFDCGTGAERYWFNVNRKDRIVGTEKERLVDGSLVLTIGDQDDVLRDSPTGIEWDIVLRKKPTSNVFEWDLQFAPGVSFHYQPDFTGSLDPMERALAEGRPEHVRGSYAVYCDRRNEYRDAAGNVIADYKTGKLSHIYRPLCHDANGVEAWAELFIDAAAHILRVTVPQEFLDTAAYPVTVDPNFGIETEGASELTLSGYSIGSHDTTLSTESGTITELKVFCRNADTNAHNLKLCVFNDSAGPSTKVGTQQILALPAFSATPSWQGVAFSGALAASTKYWFVQNPDNGYARVRYDSIASAGVYMSQTYANAFSDPWGGDTTPRSYKLSIYVVYTASGGGSVTVTDSGTGSDTINQILASLAITDAGSGSDGFGSLAAAVPLIESAYGSDSISQILAALTVTDTSTAADGLSVSALVSVADSGTGADALSVLTALLKLVTDAGVGSDAVSISVAPVVVPDGASGTDTLAVRAAVTIADMGTGADALNLVTALLKVVADAATGSDAIGGITVSVPVSDTGHGLDTIGALAVLARVLDVATGVDAVIRISGDGPDKQVVVTFTTRSAAVGFASKSAGITFN